LQLSNPKISTAKNPLKTFKTKVTKTNYLQQNFYFYSLNYIKLCVPWFRCTDWNILTIIIIFMSQSQFIITFFFHILVVLIFLCLTQLLSNGNLLLCCFFFYMNFSWLWKLFAKMSSFLYSHESLFSVYCMPFFSSFLFIFFPFSAKFAYLSLFGED
jgi:hypothetical protein